MCIFPRFVQWSECKTQWNLRVYICRRQFLPYHLGGESASPGMQTINWCFPLKWYIPHQMWGISCTCSSSSHLPSLVGCKWNVRVSMHDYYLCSMVFNFHRPRLRSNTRLFPYKTSEMRIAPLRIRFDRSGNFLLYLHLSLCLLLYLHEKE
jgi:hypothetical protein